MKLRTLSLAAAACLALVAGTGAVVPAQEVTVRVGTQSSQWADAFKAMAPEFTAETGIALEFDDISFDVMYEKMKTTFIGGASSYDMIWYDSMWTPEFAKRGWVRELSEYLKDPELTPQNFGYPEAFYGTYFTGNYPEGNEWNLPAGVWGIPWIAGFRPLYYRTDLLEEAGLVDADGKAKPPATMEELVSYAQQLNDPDNEVYGYVMPAKQPRIVYDWSGFLWTHGGDFFDADFKPIFNSEAGVKALETYIELGKVAPPGVGAYHITEAWTSYMQGRAALAWTWQDLASVARTESEIIGKFLCAAPPTYEDRRVSCSARSSPRSRRPPRTGRRRSSSSPGRCSRNGRSRRLSPAPPSTARTSGTIPRSRRCTPQPQATSRSSRSRPGARSP